MDNARSLSRRGASNRIETTDFIVSLSLARSPQTHFLLFSPLSLLLLTRNVGGCLFDHIRYDRSSSPVGIFFRERWPGF